jgi:hypothetical protein
MFRKDFRLSKRCSRRVRSSGKNRDLTPHVTSILNTKKIWAYSSKSWQPPAQNIRLHGPGDPNMNFHSNGDLKSHTAINRGAQIPGALWFWQINFVCWRLIFAANCRRFPSLKKYISVNILRAERVR